MPSAEATDVLAWPAPKGSYGDSLRIAKPESPPPLRIVAEPLAPAGEDFVHVGLMADVPNQPIGRKIEHAMQRERQLDDAEVRREVAAVDGARSNEQIANLTRQDVDFVALAGA